MSLYSIGTEIKVEMTNSELHIGRIYSYDEDSKLLVLFKGSEIVRDFLILNVNFIKNISVTDSDARGIDHDIQDIDLEKYIKEVEKRIQREIRSGTVNKKVTNKVQGIFNELCKTYQCDWDSVNITFPKFGVTINPPYTPESVVGPEQPRARISTVLAKIREKLEKLEID
jgi:hypothetical protein